jgi:hypothetical protein
VFGKIALGILAIMVWPITLGVGGLILIAALWKTFVDTKDHYRAPRDEETGEVLKSFLMGGEWDDEDPPSDEDCSNAWMFLLADAEDVTEETSELRNRLIERAIHILNLSGVLEGDEEFDAARDSIVPDLIFHLRQNHGAKWLEEELLTRSTSLQFSLDECLEAANKSEGIHGLIGDWKKQADEELKKVEDQIPDYSDEEITALAKQFAVFMRANEQNLEIAIDTYEKTSFSKALSRFEWGGETVTERGLAHMSATFSFAADKIPTSDELEQRVWDEVWEAKQTSYNYDYDYGFMFCETTSNHQGKDVRVIVDIDEAPEYYIWTVSEGAMDYDIYEEKHEGDCTTELTKAVMSVGDLTAVFEIAYESSYTQFLEQLRESIDQLNNLTPEFLKIDPKS